MLFDIVASKVILLHKGVSAEDEEITEKGGRPR